MKTDTELEHDVREALRWEPGLDAAGIVVSAADGIVTLAGSVPVYAQKFRAEAAAKTVRGVRALADDIGVCRPDGGRPTDADIAAAVLHAIKWDAEVPEEQIRVTVRDGWITLDGAVNHQYQREAADRVVRRMLGAEGLTNSILVRPRPPAADPRAGIEAALKRSALVDPAAIRVQERNGSVTLEGVVPSHAARDEAERAAWAAPGVGRVHNLLEVKS